ncbi:hypothetical protein LguiA_002092 [Lonicera macranthoides]
MELISPWFSSGKQERPAAHKKLRRTQGIATTEEEYEEFIQKPPHRRIRRLNIPSSLEFNKELQELYDSLPRFGPFYDGDDVFMSRLKEAAWQHVLSRTPTPEHETTKIYVTAVQRIGRQARDTYPDGTVKQNQRFITMMIRDGCFILQIALFLLGGSAQLNYPSDHLIFGEQRNTRQIKKWGKSLFFVGNQVPQVVLKELMKQSFFQQVVSAGRWVRPTDSFRRALYDLLLFAPEKDRRCQGLFRGLGFIKTKGGLPQQPSDLLHGLELLVIGAGGRGEEFSVDDEEYELEGGGDGDVDIDLEGGGDDGGGDFEGINSIRSATELRQAGIHFRNAKGGMGIRGIRFSTSVFCAVLELPTLEVDDDTELLFRYLQNYETTQPLARNKREARSYIRFMSELIRTADDANLLCARGIIRADHNQRQKLPTLLRCLATGDSTQNLRTIRLQIEEYSRPPWDKLRNFLSVVVLLTVLQTVYTVLSYYKN